MRKSILTAFVIIFSFYAATAQKENQPRLTNTSIVKDTSGTVVPYDIWTRLMLTGRYNVKSQKKEDAEFIIYRLSDEEYERKIGEMPKPKESRFFKTGNSFSHFKTTDINGNKINTKNLAGKIIVLNFWFINCPPCIMELPELNRLADTYKSDSSVVFIAIALDKKNELEQFLRKAEFRYMLIDNGRFLTDQYGINSYPTNVIVDHEGKIYFHSSGLGIGMAHWLQKSIDELKGKQTNKIASSQ